MVAGKTQLWLLFWSPDSWGLGCCPGRFCQTWLHLCSTWHVALPCPLARTWSITASCICGPSLLLRANFCALNGRVAAPDFRALSRLVSLSHSGAEPGCERCSSVPPAATKSFRAQCLPCCRLCVLASGDTEVFDCRAALFFLSALRNTSVAMAAPSVMLDDRTAFTNLLARWAVPDAVR